MTTRIVIDEKFRVGLWVAKQVNQQSHWGDFQAFGVEQNGEIIAGVVVHMINGANAYCHIAIEKPTKALYGLFFVVCDYCFRQLGLNRITGMVPTDEPNTIKFDKKLGFEEEFVMRNAAPGADMQVLVMWADKCRWLGKE